MLDLLQSLERKRINCVILQHYYQSSPSTKSLLIYTAIYFLQLYILVWFGGLPYWLFLTYYLCEGAI